METKNMSETLKPFYNPGPGDIIKDALEELGWQQDDLAEILGLSTKSVNLILNNNLLLNINLKEFEMKNVILL